MDSTDLAKFIAEHQIAAEIVHLPAETPTVADAAEVVGVTPAQIIKSLLFTADGEPLLVIANGTTRVDYKKIADYLDTSRRRVKSAHPAQVLAITGYEVGAVPPFGHKSRLRTLVETAVFAQTEVYGGGGEIDALLRLETAELRRVTQPEILDLTRER